MVVVDAERYNDRPYGPIAGVAMRGELEAGRGVVRGRDHVGESAPALGGDHARWSWSGGDAAGVEYDGECIIEACLDRGTLGTPRV